MILLNQITSAVLQLLIFQVFPLFGMLSHIKDTWIFEWIGFRLAPKPPLKIMLCILIGFLLQLFCRICGFINLEI